MSGFDILAIVIRWMHLVAVVIAIGGVVFVRFALMPAAREVLSDEVHGHLRSSIHARWKKVIHVCIAVLILTGAFNFYVSFRDGVPPIPYHPIFLFKILAAFLVFFLAIALSGTSPGFAKLRADGRKWSGVLIAAGILAILVSGILRVIHLHAMTTIAS